MRTIDSIMETRFLLGSLLSFAVGVWTHYLLMQSWDVMDSALAGGIGIAIWGLLELFNEPVQEDSEEEAENDGQET